MEADTVELIDYLRAIWKRKGLIIIGTLVCMLAAGVVSFLLPKLYKASVTFLLEESKFSGGKVVSQINPRILETYGKTYEGIIKNKIAMKQAIKRFKQDEEPYGLTLEEFDDMISVSIVKNSKLLRLTVVFPDPRLATDIANFLADKAIEFNNALSVTGSAENREFVREQMAAASAKMDAAEGKLLTFMKKAQLEALRKKVDILLTRKEVIESDISQADVDIAENAERLKKIEEELKKRKRTVKLSRKLAEDPLYQQSLAELSGSDVKRIFNLEMEVEIADPTYEHLEKKLVDVIPTLSGLYAKRGSLQAELKENISGLKDLQAKLADKEIKLQSLERTYDISVDSYKMFVKKFDEVTIQVASRSQDLKVLDPAVIPERPFKPKKKVNVFIAGVLGLMATLFLAFFMEYLEKIRKI